MAQNTDIELTDLIETQKFNWYRLSIIVWSCVVMAIEGYDMQLAAFAAPAIIKAWRINKSYFGPVFGFGLFGYMLGATLLASLGDRFGRKKIVVGGTLWFGVFTLAATQATSIPGLLALRFLAGLGLGASIPTTLALAVEYSPSRRRATTVGILFIGYNIGAAAAGFIAARLIPAFGWPSVFYVGGFAPILLSLILVFTLPESIGFLALKQNGSAEVSAIAAQLRPDLSFDGRERFVLREEKRSGVPARHLFTEGRAATTLLLWFAYIFSLTGQFFLTSWLPTVLVGSGLSLGHAVVTGSAVQIGGGFGGLILCWLIDKRGIRALVASFAIVAPLIVLVPWATASNILLMPLAFLIGFCLMGGLTGLNGISGTFYPTYIRSTGVGWALGVGRVGSILGPVLGGILISFDPPNSVLFTCAAAPVLCCAGALYLFARLPVTSDARQASAVP
ncbi:MAG TPA: MFS transporter [Candidatus Acidoferrales bacterium]|jgi:AAHS family 4-hydroxybenzoate transporter-like MFS transporter|nr:MFS transporter [Candidatus Acidoferrales bacterium]